jgi:hypothetical protein
LSIEALAKMDCSRLVREKTNPHAGSCKGPSCVLSDIVKRRSFRANAWDAGLLTQVIRFADLRSRTLQCIRDGGIIAQARVFEIAIAPRRWRLTAHRRIDLEAK